MCGEGIDVYTIKERSQESVEHLEAYADLQFRLLDEIKSKYPENEWSVEVRPFFQDGTTDQENREWFASKQEFVEHVLRIGDETRHIYASVNPRKGKVGTKSGTPYVFHVVADLDFKSGYTREARDQQLKDFPLRPTMVILSGGGYQAYWGLATPMERDEATILMERVSEHFDSDTIKDSSRILRVPGTWNVKPEYDTPRKVELVSIDTQKRYSPLDLSSALPAPRGENGERGKAKIEKRIVEKRNTYLCSLAGRLKNAGLEDEAIRLALMEQNRLVCDPPLPTKEIASMMTQVPGWEANTKDQTPSNLLGLPPDPTWNGGFQVFELSNEKDPGPQRWVVDGWIPEGLPSTWYGYSGSNKSYLALHLGMCLADHSVDQWMGLGIPTMKVLYVDFELDKDTHVRRGLALARGMGSLKVPEGFFYISAKGKSREEIIGWAIRFCQEKDVRYVVFDSYGFAMGGDQEKQNEITHFQQLLDLFNLNGIELHILDHTPKPQRGDVRENASIFGSVYKTNWIRSATLLVGKKIEGQEAKIVKLISKKNSTGMERNPLHIKIEWDRDDWGRERTTISPASPEDIEGVRTLSAEEKVWASLPLDEAQAMGAEDLSGFLGMNERTVKNTLSNMGKLANKTNDKYPGLRRTAKKPYKYWRERDVEYQDTNGDLGFGTSSAPIGTTSSVPDASKMAW